jgi:glycine cleavage system regulatory protein
MAKAEAKEGCNVIAEKLEKSVEKNVTQDIQIAKIETTLDNLEDKVDKGNQKLDILIDRKN